MSGRAWRVLFPLALLVFAALLAAAYARMLQAAAVITEVWQLMDAGGEPVTVEITDDQEIILDGKHRLSPAQADRLSDQLREIARLGRRAPQVRARRG